MRREKEERRGEKREWGREQRQEGKQRRGKERKGGR